MASAYDTMNKDSVKPPTAAGGMKIGSPKLTIEKRNQYSQVVSEMQMDGQAAPSWPDWLKEQGFGLDGNDNVYEAN